MVTEERMRAVEERQGWMDWRTQQIQDAMIPMQNAIIRLSLDVGDLKADMAQVKTELGQHRRILLAVAQKLEIDTTDLVD